MAIPEVVIKIGQGLAPAAKSFAVKASPVVRDAATKYAPVIKEGVIKVTPFVYDPAKQLTQKAIRKVTRTNEHGEKILRYDLDKLAKLLRKKVISREMFSYLSNELIQYEKTINKHPQFFDDLVSDLIKTKDNNTETKGDWIKDYELARGAWIHKDNNHNDDD